MNTYIHTKHTQFVYDFYPETRENIIYSWDALKDPGLVPPEIFRDLIISSIFAYGEGWEDEDEKLFSERPGWRIINGAIGLRKGAPKTAVDNWNGYIRFRDRIMSGGDI